MLKRFTWCWLLLLAGQFSTTAQAPTAFPDTPNEFIKELGAFMTASKQSSLEKIFDAFKDEFKRGTYTEEEFTLIRQLCNAMLEKKLRAGQYFGPYLETLTIIKQNQRGAENFNNWHDVLQRMLADVENRKFKPFLAFLKFSYPFFERQALKYSKNGVVWEAIADNYEMSYRERIPQIEYETLNLNAIRKKDSITIYETSGVYFPLERRWKGQSGTVRWDRFENLDRVYCTLADYTIDTSKPLYKVQSVRLHYPELFPNGDVVGSFEDKISAKNQATGTSYPRFISADSVLTIENIGGGIRYTGGFRLQGTTVHGYGSKSNKAKIAIYDNQGHRTFRGASELFVIRKGERMAGQGTEAVLYFGQDSIYHPSVNFKFQIPERELSLSRGKRGSDRNPFFNSRHQFNIDVNSMNWLMDGDSLVIGGRSVSFTTTNKEVVFESLNFYRESDYQRLQNISSTNPLATIKVYSEEMGDRILSANNLAKRFNPRFDVSSIQSLLYDLVAKGFVNYDSDKQIVEVKDKVFHYANASQDKVDYDVLRVMSVTDSTNAVMNMQDGTINARGISNIQFSVPQRVAVKPYAGQVLMKENRNMDFDGKIFAGRSRMIGKDFAFDYSKNHVEVDSVRYLDLFIATDAIDDMTGDSIALSIVSLIEHACCVLLIDAPNNMSGRDDIPIFPSFESKKNSYVYYDRSETHNGAYQRDSF